MFTVFDNVKDNLIIRPLCYFRNKKLLQDFVYWVNGDVALVLYTLMQVGDENLATAKVTKKSAENYGVISEDYLKRLALENSERRFKPILLPQETLMFGGSDIEKIPMEEKFFTNPLIDYKFQRSRIGAYYLSIDQGVNGAIAVFYPGVLKAVSSILNDDLYVTFGCVRDATVHPASEIPLKMVKSAAKSNLSNPYISEDEFLSANVYKYNRKDDTLRMLS